MFDVRRWMVRLPPKLQNQLDACLEVAGLVTEMDNPRVLRTLLPSAMRGLVLRQGKQGRPTRFPTHHRVHFDWTYPSDQPEMARLYRRAREGQWDSEELPWSTSVDPLDPEVPLLPLSFVEPRRLEAYGIRLDAREQQRFVTSFASWMLSQFLHGEQGALYAAAQVTEAIQFFDGKLYGSTQVMDEGRHVAVFHRYLTEKLQALYPINDNLFTLLDSLMSDGRWDMKFLGMQIMIEGLALGAFGTLYRQTGEPLLRELLKRVIRDEVRHVHYGVLALRDHLHQLSDAERREREDWAFEVALLMRNRFLAYELYDEWFSEGRMSRAQWREFVLQSPGLGLFRQSMFSRLIPNLREIGLMRPRMLPRYDAAGLLRYVQGAAADRVSTEEILATE